MSVVDGLLLVAVSLVAAKLLDEYVSRRRARCAEMLGMMVGMVAGMTTGLVIGEVAGFLTNMFWGNLVGLVAAVPLGAYLGRHGRLLGILDGAMAGLMGGMMGAMLGVMLQFSDEYALLTGIVLVAVQLLALMSVGYLVKRVAAAVDTPAAVAAVSGAGLPVPLPDYYRALGITPQAGPRDVAAAYLALTDPTRTAASPERLRLADEALAVLGDPIRRLAYDRARAAATAQCEPAGPAPAARRPYQVDDVTPWRKQRTQAAPDTAGAPNTTRGFRVGWGTAALVAFAIVAFGLVAARPATAACPPPPSITAQSSGAATAAPEEKQVVNLTIQYPCYYPDKIAVQRGVPVQFNVRTVGDPLCGRQLVFRGLGINRIVTPGQVTTFEFTPEQAGTYSITCAMNMMRAATFQVTE